MGILRKILGQPGKGKLITGAKISVKQDPEWDEYERKREERWARQEKAERLYGKSYQQHFKNIEDIKTLYTVARELEGYDGPQMQKCIDLCWEDIALAEDVRAYNGMANPEYNLGSYYTFSRLAIIYEKRGEYQKGIEVCQMAIDIGFEWDNDGKIYGRLARLIRKQRQLEEKQLKESGSQEAE